MRGAVMRVVPRFLWGSFRVAMKLALEEILSGAERSDGMQQERGWKLFMLLPRMLLCRSPAHPESWWAGLTNSHLVSGRS